MNSLRLLAVALSCFLLTGCMNDPPACDGNDVIAAAKNILIEQAHMFAEKPDFSCYGGCMPYIDGDKIQFLSLQTDVGGRAARSLPTFAVKSKDFLSAIEISFRNIRVVAKNDSVRSTSCTAQITTAINFSVFDKAMLQTEVIGFRNFDGNVNGWNKQREVHSTVQKELEELYTRVIGPTSIDYSAQYTTEGKVFVSVD